MPFWQTNLTRRGLQETSQGAGTFQSMFSTPSIAQIDEGVRRIGEIAKEFDL